MRRRDVIVGTAGAVAGAGALAGVAQAASRWAGLVAPPAPAFTLGVQYYRPPFPETAHWAEDLARMRDSGLNTVQLWVMWAWVEAQPGRFVFDDYDRLVELTAKHGLGVIISTIAEVHPPWIHRVVPGSEMIDHLGNKVISSHRSESHFGLTPGGCFDHPGVWARMKSFFTQVVTRYRDAPHLRAWDIWNETRWNVQADGLVCFCAHTVTAFHQWLGAQYGGLPGLNAAWKRRYGSWSDVMPGKLPRRPYTEMMAWTRFITERANGHARKRYQLVHGLDAAHPATLHGPSPCPHHQGNIAHPSYPLERGNDWAFADTVDGVGSSVFPTWWKVDDAGLSVIATHVRSAARGKRSWFSEVQGGRAAQGTEPQDPVEPAAQQRWIWSALGSGIDTMLFWCWRDEVFGGESSGYGLVGSDGFAAARLAAIKTTSDLVAQHRALIAAYRPSRPRVGVLFSPRSFHLHWAQSGAGYPARYALESYARVLTKLSVPWITVEEDHTHDLTDLALLFLPRTVVVDEPLAERLTAFVQGGGTLVAESECGAFSTEGFWRPPEDRFLARRFGIKEVGRRTLVGDTIRVLLDERAVVLPAAQWLTPFEVGRGRAWATHADGDLVTEVTAGKGRIISIGAYVADPHRDRWSADFEAFVAHIVRTAGVTPDAEVLAPAPTRDAYVFIKTGASAGRPVAFVIAPTGATGVELRFRPGLFDGGRALDLISGQELKLVEAARASKAGVPPQGRQLTLPPLPWGLAVLVAAA